MRRRLLPQVVIVAAVGLAAAVALATGPRAAAQGPCDGSAPNPPVANPHVIVSGLPTTPGNELGLAVAKDGGGDVLPDSVGYEVDGPAGHASLAADRYFNAQFTPGVAGGYSIVAHWREYACADDRPAYADVTTPPSTFTTIAGDPPTVTVSTSRRPKVANSPGDATLEAFLNCPTARHADATPTRLAIYYAFGGRLPTHGSKHSVLSVKQGCRAGTGVPSRRVSGTRFRLEISRGLAAFEVTAPARADVLIELSYGGKLLKRVRGRFRPSSTGEKVKRG